MLTVQQVLDADGDEAFEEGLKKGSEPPLSFQDAVEEFFVDTEIVLLPTVEGTNEPEVDDLPKPKRRFGETLVVYAQAAGIAIVGIEVHNHLVWAGAGRPYH